MIFLDLDQRLSLHLAMALELHRKACRANGLALPEALDELAQRCWTTARADSDRQEPPTLADLVDTLHGPRVERLFTSIADAATALGISSRAVERLVADGALPSALVGGRRLIHVRDLEDYAESLRPASSFRDRVDAKVAPAFRDQVDANLAPASPSKGPAGRRAAGAGALSPAGASASPPRGAA